MKATVATRFGEPAEVLKLKTLAHPQPPVPGEVMLRAGTGAARFKVDTQTGRHGGINS
jgi:NADPH:quinone reductase-like Zn-dependent oxidoreductase